MSNDGGRRGRLVVISGPSGVGKTSICDALLARDERTTWSVSWTTRPPRGKECDGQAYKFVSRQEFEQAKEQGAFLEWAEYCGNLYGTPIEAVRQAVAQGLDVVMEIDVQGGAQVAAREPNSTRIFVMPPTMESLRARLEGRQTDSAEALKKRLAEADGEIGFARDSGAYPHFVVNDVLDETIKEVVGIIEAERQADAKR